MFTISTATQNSNTGLEQSVYNINSKAQAQAYTHRHQNRMFYNINRNTLTGIRTECFTISVAIHAHVE